MSATCGIDLRPEMTDPSNAPLSAQNRTVRRDRSWLSGVVVRRTTDLLLIAIVAGGLLTAAFNLAPDTSIHTAQIRQPGSQAGLLPDILEEPAALSALHGRETIGDEQAAWDALVQDLKLAASSAVPIESTFDPEMAQDIANWTLIAADADAKWSIRRPPELPRMAVAVSEQDGNPLICAWGMIRSTGEGTWSVSVVRSP